MSAIEVDTLRIFQPRSSVTARCEQDVSVADTDGDFRQLLGGMHRCSVQLLRHYLMRMVSQHSEESGSLNLRLEC